MSSISQIHANRQNSQKSTGPRSAEGKAVSAKNAVKHGLFAQEAVITGENRQDYEAFRDELIAELAPAGAMESVLAERFVSLSWRLQRIERIQNLVIDSMIERELTSPLANLTEQFLPKRLRKPKSETNSAHSSSEMTLGKIAIKDCANSRVLERLLMYERRIENSLFKTTKELDRRKIMRQLGIANAADETDTYERIEQVMPDGPSPSRRYEASTLSEQKNAKQSQLPGFDRKSEALNPKSETISNIKTLNYQNKSAYSAQERNLKKQSKSYDCAQSLP